MSLCCWFFCRSYQTNVCVFLYFCSCPRPPQCAAGLFGLLLILNSFQFFHFTFLWWLRGRCILMIHTAFSYLNYVSLPLQPGVRFRVIGSNLPATYCSCTTCLLSCGDIFVWNSEQWAYLSTWFTNLLSSGSQVKGFCGFNVLTLLIICCIDDVSQPAAVYEGDFLDFLT